MIIAQFKDSDKSDKKSGVGKKIGGVALLGGSAAIGTQSIRSGLPRALGVRLEQHGTSRKAAANIIKEGYLDPGYGGTMEGVTSSMKLPKEFLERSKGYTFLSGKNPDHVFWDKRNGLSSIGDVITRKIQVLGYRGSKAGKLTDKDVERGSKFIGARVTSILKPFKKQLDAMTPEKILENLKKQSVSNAYSKAEYDKYVADPELLRRDLKSMRRDIEKLVKNTQDVAKRGYKDPSRVKSIRKTQVKFNKLFNDYKDEFKKYQRTRESTYGYSNESYWGKKAGKTDYDRLFENFLETKVNSGDKKAARLLKLKDGLKNQLKAQEVSKNLGLSAGWTQKLLQSPLLGAAGVGKTVYLPGTDEYFNDTNRFKYDVDDPFGNPLKYMDSFTSEKGGLGGNALKTKEKVRAFGNRFSASKYLLEKEGDGNLIKGASKLMGANKGRVLAGLGILGVGGTAAGLLGAKGIQLIRGKDDKKKVVVQPKVIAVVKKPKQEISKKNEILKALPRTILGTSLIGGYLGFGLGSALGIKNGLVKGAALGALAGGASGIQAGLTKYKERKDTLENYKLPSRKIKVKAYARKGKLVQTFERLNPFYNKDKQGK
jgi:uncharacterized protein YcfJ